MADGKEIEIKLGLPLSALAQVENAPLLRELSGKAETKRLVSLYFDTRKRKLRKTGMSLRIRDDEERHVQTIKAEQAVDGSSFGRGEWETEVEGLNPDLDSAKQTALAPLVTRKLRRSLKPIFETRVERKVFPVRSGGASIEAALDRGTIEADGKSAEICELELELKDGDPSELFKIAQKLSKSAPLELELRSKADRGYALVQGAKAGAVKADEVRIAADATAADAFRAIARNCLRQMAGNHDPVLSGDAEGIHQMRVGLRRLRAALSIFSGMLDDDESRHVKDELKWLTEELGPARELDVFITRVVQPLQAERAHEDAVRALCQDVLRRRDEAYRRARNALVSERYRRLMLDVAGWIETGGWLTVEDELATARRERAASTFAAEELSRRHAKIVKRGRKLRELDPLERHKLRIAAKKLRYGAEFFAGLFPGGKAAKRRKSFVQSLKGLQGCLGTLNDIVAHEALTARIADDAASRRNRQSQLPFIAGIASGREESRTEPLLRTSLDEHRDFARAKPFWR